jgi:hypothetical protein
MLVPFVAAVAVGPGLQEEVVQRVELRRPSQLSVECCVIEVQSGLIVGTTF